MKIRIMILLLLLTNSSSAHYESYYQDIWCNENNGEQEHVLPDRTRVDCLTETHAVEMDFGSKWHEAIGQSLYYSLQTNLKAGIVLILKKENDYRYFIRLNSTINHHKLDIDTWLIKGYETREEAR